MEAALQDGRVVRSACTLGGPGFRCLGDLCRGQALLGLQHRRRWATGLPVARGIPLGRDGRGERRAGELDDAAGVVRDVRLWAPVQDDQLVTGDPVPRYEELLGRQAEGQRVQVLGGGHDDDRVEVPESERHALAIEPTRLEQVADIEQGEGRNDEAHPLPACPLCLWSHHDPRQGELLRAAPLAPFQLADAIGEDVDAAPHGGQPECRGRRHAT